MNTPLFQAIRELQRCSGGDSAVQILDANGVTLDEIGEHFKTLMHEQDAVIGPSLEPPPVFHEWAVIASFFPAEAYPTDGPSILPYEFSTGRV